MALQWPQSFATVFEKVLPPHVVQNVLNAADNLADSPNYWTAKKAFAGSHVQHLPAEAAIQALYRGCMQGLLPDTIAGAEYWVQVYKPGKGLAFHFDKDETLFKERQEMKHPVLSSVLYLSGSRHEQRLGPTVVVEQQFDNSKGCAFPPHPQKSALVWPQLNSLCVFDGRLGHGVLNSAAQEKRVTMLINWWAYQPQAVHCPPSPPPQLAQPCGLGQGGSDGPDAAQQTGLSLKQVSLEEGGLRGSGFASSPEQTPPERDGDNPRGPPTRAATAVVRVPPVDEPQAITIDDLMDSFNLTLQGDTAIAALAIEHAGFQLYPTGDDEEEQLQSLKTAGALVSSELMGSDSDGSSE